MLVSESLYLIAAVLGILISLALISQVFTDKKGNFFLGLVMLLFSFEILFSWGALSGYNNSEGAFHIGLLLNYLIVPPSIWLFVQYSTAPSFKWKPWYYLLFIPALIQLVFQLLSRTGGWSLRGNLLWVFFVDYLPLLGFIAALAFFWIRYFRLRRHNAFKASQDKWLPRFRVLLLMGGLSLICLAWIVFSFIGWEYFEIIELILVVLIFALAFLNFLGTPQFPTVIKSTIKEEFPGYKDEEQLKRLDYALSKEEQYLDPDLSLKSLATTLGVPSRYVSYLINRYHHKNFKEYINNFRLDAFLKKAQSEEAQQKTLLALALESGFSSKSTFNQVFKNRFGKSPSQYLNQN